MTYTPDVPQPNQQIAATQGPILSNFEFIQTDAEVEHVFNGNAPFGPQAEGTHIQASMPNQSADFSSLPGGCAGIYYVKGNLAKFYNTAGGAQFLQSGPLSVKYFTGTIVVNGSLQTFFTAPPFSCGQYWLVPTVGGIVYGATGMFFSNSANVSSGDVSSPKITTDDSGLNIKVAYSDVVAAGTYKILVVYYTP